MTLPVPIERRKMRITSDHPIDARLEQVLAEAGGAGEAMQDMAFIWAMLRAAYGKGYSDALISPSPYEEATELRITLPPAS